MIVYSKIYQILQTIEIIDFAQLISMVNLASIRKAPRGLAEIEAILHVTVSVGERQ